MEKLLKAPWEVRITQVDDGGLIVSVGCKTLVFSKAEIGTFAAFLEGYFRNPSEAIKAANERYSWPSFDPGLAAADRPEEFNPGAIAGAIGRARTGVRALRLGAPGEGQADNVPDTLR